MHPPPPKSQKRSANTTPKIYHLYAHVLHQNASSCLGKGGKEGEASSSSSSSKDSFPPRSKFLLEDVVVESNGFHISVAFVTPGVDRWSDGQKLYLPKSVTNLFIIESVAAISFSFSILSSLFLSLLLKSTSMNASKSLLLSLLLLIELAVLATLFPLKRSFNIRCSRATSGSSSLFFSSNSSASDGLDILQSCPLVSSVSFLFPF
mmetsp:Transcript_847/g.3085  ORF Transcript_847/g.3085 Transcript_847/m.3085 type:complete len:206 (+) Transcript_847:1995-2612(+)